MSSSSSKLAAASDAPPPARRRWLQRPLWSCEALVALVAAYLVLAGNPVWWAAVAAGRSLADPEAWLFFAGCAVALIALHAVLLLLPATRWTLRPWLTLVVLASAVTLHFMRTYNVVLDASMLRNVLATDPREAGELMTPTLLRDVIGWSVLPLALVWWPRIARGSLRRAAIIRVVVLIIALLVAVAALASISRDFIPLMRNRHELRYLITPGNLLVGLTRIGLSEAGEPAGLRQVVGSDARRLPPAAGARPRVFVLVVGETARAANFSLNGYSRITNPELSRLDVVNFADVTSCGTSTEESIPCMFSPWGRADYDERRTRGSEGLLHVLARAGYDVRWIENQSGCKGVCDGAGIVVRTLGEADAPTLCRDGECHDAVLLEALRQELASPGRDKVVVLHMMGNHGPAYYARYPDEFRRFVPDCRKAELRRCTREQIVDAYDNGILYTDHLLARAIRLLQSQAARLDAALLYVSDHGESLGEGGLYLHGMPYPIAPSVQTKVPMVYWQSEGFARSTGLDLRCIRARSGSALSHDNLFHSVLGLLEVRTAVRRPERDLFAPCMRRADAPDRASTLAQR